MEYKIVTSKANEIHEYYLKLEETLCKKMC